ncbi:MAG: replicative DNA helicase [Chloroflexota bacterium]|nr:replicative DNA helicase [Chloroflexota bacterium]
MTDELNPNKDTLSEAITLPSNREAEEALIGAVLINQEVYLDVSQFLEAENFFIVRNQWIWEAFQHLSEARQPIDMVTVTETLTNRGQLDETGGQAYLISLINQAPNAFHAESYGRIIEQNAIRRRMLEAANEIARLAYSQDQSIDTVVDEAEKAIFNVSERRIKRDLVPIREVVRDYYDRIDELSQRPDDIYGVPTGLIDVDSLLGGLQKSDFLIIAGRPGMGKTGFLLGTMRNAALIHKKHVAMFSMEMSNEQLLQRMIAMDTRIDTQRLRSGRLNDNEWDIFFQALESYDQAMIFLDDTPAITPLSLRTKCRRLHLEYGLDLIIVDYLQLMSGDYRTDNRVQEVSNISRNMKVLARELNVPVLTAAQLSRAVEHRPDKKPQLSDLRESGSLEQDADIVMFIHRNPLSEIEEERNKSELIVAKHRNGPTHPGIGLVFIEELAKFENAARGQQMEG